MTSQTQKNSRCFTSSEYMCAAGIWTKHQSVRSLFFCNELMAFSEMHAYVCSYLRVYVRVVVITTAGQRNSQTEVSPVLEMNFSADI